MDRKKIVLVGGGTNGHLNPALSIKEILTEHDCYIITDKRCEKYIGNDDKNVWVLDVPIPKKNFRNFISYLKCFYLTVKYFWKLRPSLVVGFGGYVSFIPILVGKIFGAKIILHEQNMIVAKISHYCLFFSDYLALSFKYTKNFFNNGFIVNDKIRVTGNPIRSKFELIKSKQFDKKIFRILIFGGTQGAQVFTEKIPNVIKFLKEKYPSLKIEIIQQVSSDSIEKVKKFYLENDIESEIRPYFDDIKLFYSKCNLVISRSGASTIFELISQAQPAILIPYPTSYKNHQLYNAQYIQSNEAGILIEEKHLDAKLIDRLSCLIDDFLDEVSNKILVKYSNNLIKLQDDWSFNLKKLILESIT